MPGSRRLEISCARISVTAMMRHIFNCAARSSRMERRITKPKLVNSCWVKTVVCVMNPGPIAEVAIKNAAPSKADLVLVEDIVSENYRNQITKTKKAVLVICCLVLNFKYVFKKFRKSRSYSNRRRP